MAFKHTIFFEARTNASGKQDGARVGGWSESYYAQSQYHDIDDPFDKLVRARAGLLPSTSRIIGYRIADTSKQTAGIVRNRIYHGTWNATADLPTMAFLCRGFSATGNRLQLILRGLPDKATEEGEYSTKSDTWQRFLAFRQHLPSFFQVCRNLQAAAADIISIAEDGSVVTRQDLPGNNVGVRVWVQRTKSALQGNFNGLYTIEARTGPSLFKLSGWQGGFAGGGRVRLYGTVEALYPPNMRIERVITRRVGRPLFSFVGRR
jgi:hypothetical protein